MHLARERMRTEPQVIGLNVVFLARLIGFSGYLNGSAIQLFMPRSRSDITNTSVWNCSANSNASWAMLKHSSAEHGISKMCLVSPWERNAVERMSPCEVRVGRPVEGPTRWMSQITPGTSV